MKWLITLFLVTLVLMLFVMPGQTEENKNGYIRQSYIDPRKTVIFEDNKPNGYLRKSYINPNHVVQYDKDGKELGYYRKDYINPNRTIWIDKKDIKK